MLVNLDRREIKYYRHSPIQLFRWSSSLPFVRNNRGRLIHRPRYGVTFSKNGPVDDHFTIHYYCGCSASSSTINPNLQLISCPNESEIVCHRCEKIAIELGLLSSEDIAGGHVHIGRCIAKADCHDIEVNQ